MTEATKGFCTDCVVPGRLEAFIESERYKAHLKDREVRAVAATLVRLIGKSGICQVGQPEVDDIEDDGNVLLVCQHEYASKVIGHVEDALSELHNEGSVLLTAAIVSQDELSPTFTEQVQS